MEQLPIETGKTEQVAELEEKHSHTALEDAGVAKLVSNYATCSQMEIIKLFKKNVFVCMLVLFITANDGYQQSLPGQLVANPGFIKQFATVTDATGAPALAAKVVAAWGGVYSAGYIVSLLASPFPNDWFGRKCGMAILGGSCILGTIVSTVARTWGVWAFAKFLNGIAVGFAQSTLTAYVSEMAPTQIRGGLLAMYSVFWAIGQFAAAICLYALQLDAPQKYLRAIYTEWIFSGIFIMTWLYIPESPSWYIRKGKDEKAKKVLKRVNGGIPGYDVEHEFAVIKATVEEGEAQAASYGKVNWTSIYRGVNLRRTWVSFFPLAVQQLIGIPVVFGQTSLFFKSAGLSNPFMGTVIVQIILLVFIGVSFVTVDKIGRRPLYLVNGVVMVLSLLVIGICGSVGDSSAKTYCTVVFLCLWVAAYATSAGPLGYIFLAESSTLALRAKTTGHAAAGTGIFGLIFNYCTPLMILSTGGGAGWGIKTGYFYAATASISLVLFYFTVPETKGRSYPALQELFERKVPARKFKSTTTSVEEAALALKGDV